MDQEPSREICENLSSNLMEIFKERVVVLDSKDDEEMSRRHKSTRMGGVERPKKKVRAKYKEMFIQKQLQLLENLKKNDVSLAAEDGDRRKYKADCKQLSYTERKLKRLREGVKFSKKKKTYRSQISNDKEERRKTRMDLNKSDSGIEIRMKPTRRRSLEVAKLGVVLPKPYRQIILERKPKLSTAPERSKHGNLEMDRDDRELSEILKVKIKNSK